MKKFFLLKNGQQVGPFSVDDLKSKKIKKTNLVWAEGMADWLKAGEMAELKSLFTVTPPPPPKAAAPPPPPPPAASQYQAPPPPQQPETPQYQTPPPQQNYAAAPAQQNAYVPKPGGGMVIGGYITAFILPIVGLALGGYLKSGKQKLPDGTKVKKFDAKAQKNGLIIMIIAAVSWAFWIQMTK